MLYSLFRYLQCLGVLRMVRVQEVEARLGPVDPAQLVVAPEAEGLCVEKLLEKLLTGGRHRGEVALRHEDADWAASLAHICSQWQGNRR